MSGSIPLPGTGLGLGRFATNRSRWFSSALVRNKESTRARSWETGGDWEGYPDPTARFLGAPGTLHIRQGYDGGLTAWLDRTIQTDQRNGERLSVLSVTQSAIVLGTVSDWGAKHRYEGTLSGDGKQMGGQWHS